MLYLTPMITAYCLVLFTLLGLVFGSFGNAWAWRITHKEKIARGRSHCAVCGHVLAPLDLVPLLSYLALGGKCRYCGAKISPRYPAAEAVCCALFVSLLFRYGLTVDLAYYLIFGFLLFVLSLVDLESCIIPDRFLVLALVNYLVFTALRQRPFLPALGHDLLCGVALAVPLMLLVLLMDRLLGRESMGGGDIKLLFVLGLYLGAAKGLLLLILACVIGLLLSSLPALHGRDTEDPRAIPFGPSLSLAAWLVMLWGDAALSWYLNLF